MQSNRRDFALQFFAPLFLVIFNLPTICNAVDLAALNSLTGSAHTRIVWLEGGDALYGGGKLIGYNSRTNQVTQILPAAFRQNRPIICHGGHKVVVSINYQVFIVNWDGSNKQFIVDGYCSDVWVHPQTGQEWALVRTGENTTDGPVYRYLISDPTQKVLLTDVAGRKAGFEPMNWLQMSQDGLMSVDLMPWPLCGLVTYQQPAAEPNMGSKVDDGCWSSVAPDNSYNWFVFSSGVNHPTGHSALAMFKNRTYIGNVSLTSMTLPSNTSRGEYYHPKFASNGAQWFVVTGGYEGNLGFDENLGNKVEVYLGKFNSAFTGLAGWTRVTNNAINDLCPDAWVGVASTNPTLELSQSGLQFMAQQGGANPDPQLLTVSTPYGALSSVSASSNQSWLTISAQQLSASSWRLTNQANIGALGSGVHSAQVTVTAPDATPTTTTYTVTITITGAAMATTVQITPVSAKAVAGSTLQLSAQVLDQTGVALAVQPLVQWSASGSGDGSISSSGLFSAGTAFTTYAVQASYGAIFGVAHIVVEPAQAINIITPTPGATCSVGSALQVRWEAASTVAGVTIELSVDNGDNWTRISPMSIARTDAQWGDYSWTITPTITPSGMAAVSSVSSQGLLRIADYFAPEIQDELESSFTIAANSAVGRPLVGGSGKGPAVQVFTTGIKLAHLDRATVGVYTIAGRSLAVSQLNTNQLIYKQPAAGQHLLIRTTNLQLKNTFQLPVLKE